MVKIEISVLHKMVLAAIAGATLWRSAMINTLTAVGMDEASAEAAIMSFPI